MAHGLPVVVTAVGGLVEATAGYEGAVLVQPRDPSRRSPASGRGPPALAALRRRDGWDATAQR